MYIYLVLGMFVHACVLFYMHTCINSAHVLKISPLQTCIVVMCFALYDILCFRNGLNKSTHHISIHIVDSVYYNQIHR